MMYRYVPTFFWSGQRRPQRPPLDLSKEPHGDDAGGLGDLPHNFFVTRWGKKPSTDIRGLHKLYIVLYSFIYIYIIYIYIVVDA